VDEATMREIIKVNIREENMDIERWVMLKIAKSGYGSFFFITREGESFIILEFQHQLLL
jgi:hypothetical protein